MTPSPRHSTCVGAIAAAIFLAASGAIIVPAASAITGATTRVVASSRYHIDLPGAGLPRDVVLGPPSDMMNDGTTSAGITGGNVGVEGRFNCSGDVAILLGQAFSGTAGGTADFGLLLASADARIENTPADINCPGTTPEANSYPGNTATTVTATFDDFVTVGSASGLPVGTMKHLRFTAVVSGAVGGSGGSGARAVVLYTVTHNVGSGSPTVNTDLGPDGFPETFPPSGQSSQEVDVAVGTRFRYSGILTVGAGATGGTVVGANANSGDAHAFIDSDDADVVLVSASGHDYRSNAVSTTTTSTTTTLPPATLPPATLPPSTLPPSTLPPATLPPLPPRTLDLVSADSFVLKDSAVPRKRRAAFASSDPAFSTAGLDPRTGGAEVRLFGPDTGASDVWALPASGWTIKKGKYRYGDKAHAYGPVVSAIVADKRITLQANGAAITYPLLGTAPRAIALALVLPAGPSDPTAAVCAELPGAQGPPNKKDLAKRLFRATKAKAPLSCRALR